MGFLTKIDRSLTAIKSIFTEEDRLPYAQLVDGTHSYNYETERFGLMGLLGLGNSYYTPKDNLKWYYENVSFLGDCINLYSDIASQVKIEVLDAGGNPVEHDILKLLEQPNEWQDQIAFIKEMVINTLTSGINVMYGNFFKNGKLRINPNLYNIDFFNLSMPKIKDPYGMTRQEIRDLTFKEHLDDGKYRNLKYYELAFIYDTIAKNTYGDKGFNSEKFLNPISRVFSLRKDLHALLNTSDNMAFLSEKKVNWLVSKEANAGALAPLQTAEKNDIETKLSAKRNIDVIATNESLKAQTLQRDVKKMQLTEMQNNAKENVRSRYGIPRDLLDAYTGTNSGSTYENQQFAEARFVLNSVKNITDTFLYQIEKKMPNEFEYKGLKLIGTYDHMASVQAVNKKLKNEGFKAKSDALMSFLTAFEKSQTLGIALSYEDFLKNNGFEEFLKLQE